MQNKLTTVNTALSKILKSINALSSKEIPIFNSLGETLSSPVYSKICQPSSDVSSMDGYAVLDKDLEDEMNVLRCIDESSAGHPSLKPLKPGETIRIFTGAKLPKGSNKIILQENVEVDRKNKDLIIIKNKINNKSYIRKRGMDFKANEKLLNEGHIMNSRSVALATASGNVWTSVRSKPRIAIISTGDELIRPGDFYNNSNNNNIISSNGTFLYLFIKQMGGDPFFMPIAKDNLNSLDSIINNAQGSDLIVSSGGASVGDYDLVQIALNNINFKLDFWKISMRPGKPLFFGKLGKIPFLGLPGNPVSTGICSIVFLQSIIKKFLGQKIQNDIIYLPVGSELKENDHRQDYLRARYSKDKDNNIIVIPFNSQDSGQLSIFSKAECFIIRFPNQKSSKSGEIVPVLKIPNLI